MTNFALYSICLVVDIKPSAKTMTNELEVYSDDTYSGSVLKYPS